MAGYKPASKTTSAPIPATLDFPSWLESILQLSKGPENSPSEFISDRILLHGIPSKFCNPANIREFLGELYWISEHTGLQFDCAKIEEANRGNSWELFPDKKSGTHSSIIFLEDAVRFSPAPAEPGLHGEPLEFPIFLELTLPRLGVFTNEGICFQGNYSFQGLPQKMEQLMDAGDVLVALRGAPNDKYGASIMVFIQMARTYISRVTDIKPHNLTVLTVPHYTHRRNQAWKDKEGKIKKDRDGNDQKEFTSLLEYLLVVYVTDSQIIQKAQETLGLPRWNAHRLVEFPAWTLIMAPLPRTVLAADLRSLNHKRCVTKIYNIKPDVPLGQALVILGHQEPNRKELQHFELAWLETGRWHAPQGTTSNTIVLVSLLPEQVYVQLLTVHQLELAKDSNGSNAVGTSYGQLAGWSHFIDLALNRKKGARNQSAKPPPPDDAARQGKWIMPTTGSSRDTRRGRAAGKTTQADTGGAAVNARRPRRQTDDEGYTATLTKTAVRQPYKVPNFKDAVFSGDRPCRNIPSDCQSVSTLSSIQTNQSHMSYAAAANLPSAAPPRLMSVLHTHPELQRGFHLRYRVRWEKRNLKDGSTEASARAYKEWKRGHAITYTQLKNIGPDEDRVLTDSMPAMQYPADSDPDSEEEDADRESEEVMEVSLLQSKGIVSWKSCLGTYSGLTEQKRTQSL